MSETMRQFIDIVNTTLTEHAHHRKKVLEKAKGIAPQLAIHVVKLIGLVASDSDRAHWKAECFAFLGTITAAGLKGGGHLKERDFHLVLFDGPFEQDSMGVDKVGSIFANHADMRRNELTDDMVFDRVTRFYSDLCPTLSQGGNYGDIINGL